MWCGITTTIAAISSADRAFGKPACFLTLCPHLASLFGGPPPAGNLLGKVLLNDSLSMPVVQ